MKKTIIVGLVTTALSFGVIIPNFANSVDASTSSSQNQTSSVRQMVINKGMKYLGTPYEFGSSRSSTRTFDCSDFVRQAYKEGTGITLPSNSRTQAAFIKKNGRYTTNWRDLKPGDIMFFMSYKGSSASDYRDIDKKSSKLHTTAFIWGTARSCKLIPKNPGAFELILFQGSSGKNVSSSVEASLNNEISPPFHSAG